jgi:hypothetical protein
LTFTGLNFFVGTDTFNPPKLEYLADFWFDAGRTSLFDLSIVANRRKFIDPLGKPVDLGATGSIPTGSPPAFFLRRAPADAPALFANDRSGNGNNFTITGALVNSPSSPTD